MPAQKGVTVISTDYPLYTILMVGETNLLLAGGGGTSKTGVPNVFELYELKLNDGCCVPVRTKQYGVDAGAIMNSSVYAKTKQLFTLALGVDGTCHLFSLRQTLASKNTSSEGGLRKRKGEKQATGAKVMTFEVEELTSTKTDFGPDDGFQKVSCITPDGAVMATGGSDGHLRTWKFPDLEPLYAKKAHDDEIDDMHISPSGHKIVTVSRDGKAYIWNTKDGSKQSELAWTLKKDAKYRYRSCRFTPVEDKKDTYNLFTTNIPCTRGGKNPPSCYITRWDTRTFLMQKCQKTGTEVLSSFAASSNGVYLGVGTLSGSVSVYIAFSLQKLYHVREAHSIFVTGLEFAPFSETSRSVTGDNEVTLFSISADKQVKIHQVAERGYMNVGWIVVGFLCCLYLIYWLIITLGL